MKKLLILLITALSLTTAYGQTELLNQLDSSGKKDGKWILYLNGRGYKVKDSTKAVYWRYTYYDHGVHIYPMGGFIPKNGKIEEPPNNKQIGKIKMLHGEYKCYNKKGKLKYIQTFKNGEYVSYKEYTSTGELESFFDYTKGCEGQPHSWTIYIYDKKGNVIITSPTCKDINGKWPKMRG